jgi:hypothetical protein
MARRCRPYRCYLQAALTFALMPARIASGRSGQAATSAALIRPVR